jgi:hypothetical protein
MEVNIMISLYARVVKEHENRETLAVRYARNGSLKSLVVCWCLGKTKEVS